MKVVAAKMSLVQRVVMKEIINDLRFWKFTLNAGKRCDSNPLVCSSESAAARSGRSNPKLYRYVIVDVIRQSVIVQCQ